MHSVHTTRTIQNKLEILQEQQIQQIQMENDT